MEDPSAEDSCRLFLAVDLPVDVKSSLSEVQNHLKTGCRFVDAHPRWVAVENLHLTLVFLGDVDATRIPDIRETMDMVCSNVAPFDVTVTHLGLFPPDSKAPKVVTVDVRSRSKAPRQLHEKLRIALIDRGFELETRPFRPHLTLARLPSVKTASRLGSLVASHADRLNSKFPVVEIVLFESRLGPEGPAYYVKHTSTLSA